MICTICKNGETEQGETTVTLNRNETTIIIKGVPSLICNNCGEYYLDEQISEQVLAIAEKAVDNHAEIEVLRFAA